MILPSLVEVLFVEGCILAIGVVVGYTRIKRNKTLAKHALFLPLVLPAIPTLLFATISLPAVLYASNSEWTLFDWICRVVVLGIMSIMFLWVPYAIGLFVSHRAFRQSAAKTPSDSELSSTDAIETGNPYQSPLS